MEIPAWAERQVAVVGDAILDVWLTVRFWKPSAEDGAANCYDIVEEMKLPGGVGSTARCVSGLGGRVELYAVSGAGSSANRLKHALEEHGIRAKLTPMRDRPTDVKTRAVDADNGRQVFVFENRPREPIPDAAADLLIADIQKTTASVIVVSDFDRGVVTPRVARAVSAFCRESGRKLVVDARPRPLAWYRENFPDLHLLTPNRSEAEALLGRSLKTDEDIDRAGDELRKRLQCNVLLKLSEDGAWLFPLEGESRHYTAHNDHPECVCGAGDSYVGTIGLSLAAGVGLDEACEFGAYAAAVTVGKKGSQVVDKAGLEDALRAVQQQ